jgi:hypothetical protein
MSHIHIILLLLSYTCLNWWLLFSRKSSTNHKSDLCYPLLFPTLLIHCLRLHTDIVIFGLLLSLSVGTVLVLVRVNYIFIFSSSWCGHHLSFNYHILASKRSVIPLATCREATGYLSNIFIRNLESHAVVNFNQILTKNKLKV